MSPLLWLMIGFAAGVIVTPLAGLLLVVLCIAGAEGNASLEAAEPSKVVPLPGQTPGRAAPLKFLPGLPAQESLRPVGDYEHFWPSAFDVDRIPPDSPFWRALSGAPGSPSRPFDRESYP